MIKIEDYVKLDTMFSAFQSTFQKDFYFSGERHNYWELVCVIDGDVGVTEDDKIYSMTAGEFILHKPMEFHRIWAENGTTPSVIILSFSMLKNDFDILGNGIFSYDEALLELIQKTLYHYEHCKSFDDPLRNQLLANCFERFLLILMQTHIPNTSTRKTIGSQNYKKIIHVLNENISQNLSTEEIADLCCLSISNLKKTFKKYSGMGLMEYYNNLKISHAKKMLAYGEQSITQISDSLGYSNPSYFSKIFKKECGYTPLKYRKKHEVEEGYIYELKKAAELSSKK